MIRLMNVKPSRVMLDTPIRPLPDRGRKDFGPYRRSTL